MPNKNTEIQAIYEDLTIVSYDKASGAERSVPLDFQPALCFGGNAKTGTDVTFNENGLTFSANYLASLDLGDYRFWASSESNREATFTLRVTDSLNTPKAEPNYEKLTGIAKEFYEKPTFSYQGKTYHRVVSTEAEFRATVEYFTFVEGALQMQKENDRLKGYTFEFYLIGNFEELKAHVLEISFPMHPRISYGTRSTDTGTVVTLTVTYQDGLNGVVSSQVPDPIEDRQNLLTSAGRPADYNRFPIDSLTKTSDVRTIYELETLPCGMKPTFADAATDAKAVYEQARSILREMIDDGMDDYAKVAAIYAWLAENVTYDTVAVTTSNAIYSAYTVKGALIDRVAVCDGYASAFRLLCQIEGIRAEEVTGTCNQQGSVSGHAWNKVWIGGAVYGVDSTWARPTGSEFITLQYLFVSEKDLYSQKHYENATIENAASRVVTLADASIFSPTAVIFSYGTLGLSRYDFYIDSEREFNAMVTYLKNKQISVAEFYNNTSQTLYGKANEYAVYSSTVSNYCYIEFI